MKPQFGVFTDIKQQNGSIVRMHYPWTKQNEMCCKWIGIQEQTAHNYREKS